MPVEVKRGPFGISFLARRGTSDVEARRIKY
jgi:hypothetical protein